MTAATVLHSRKRYISAEVSQRAKTMLDPNVASIVMSLYGPQGGSIATVELSTDNAEQLYRDLGNALRK